MMQNRVNEMFLEAINKSSAERVRKVLRDLIWVSGDTRHAVLSNLVLGNGNPSFDDDNDEPNVPSTAVTAQKRDLEDEEKSSELAHKLTKLAPMLENTAATFASIL
jgi:hypothetical protein